MGGGTSPGTPPGGNAPAPRANPYFVEGPALISFSGGRTSAFMLWNMLAAHGGSLPSDVHVCFANTGKEREETLRFVHECATRWGVRVRWLEFLTDLKSVGPAGRFEEVGYNSASRNGEPLSRLIVRKGALFSTMTGRWCTQFCKVRVMHDFMAASGFPPRSYAEVIGFRADEGDRVYELSHHPRNDERRLIFPLSVAGVRKPNIYSFWRAQPFDLHLKRGTGNCDQCPFLNTKNRVTRMRLNPAGTPWWKAHEAERNFSFGYESMADIERMAWQSPVMPLTDDEAESADTDCMGWCGSAAA